MTDKPSGTISYGRIITIILHILAMILFLGGVTVIYCNSNFKRGVRQLNAASYEDSESFNDQFNRDIDMIFDYIETRSIFESEKGFDPDREVIAINGGPNLDLTYTTADVLAEASRRGYQIGEDYRILSGPVNPADPRYESYSVTWSAYDDEDDGGLRTVTIDELIAEVLEKLYIYNAGYTRFYLMPCNLHFEAQYGSSIITNSRNFTREAVLSLGRYALCASDSRTVESNLPEIPVSLKAKTERCSLYEPDMKYHMYIAVDTAYPCQDVYSENCTEYRMERERYFYALICTFTGLVAAILTLVILVIMAVRENPADRQKILIKGYRMSAEGRILLCACAIVVALFLNEKVFKRILHVFLPLDYWEFAEMALGYGLIYMCICVTAFSLLRSVKDGNLWERSFTKRCYDAVDTYIGDHRFSERMILGILSFITIDALLIAGTVLLAVYQVTLVHRFIIIGLVLAFIALNMYVIFTLYKRQAQIDKLAGAVKNIAEGHTGYQLDLKEFDSKELDIAEDINNISNGLETALDEKMRSERMKTDLITNVSHDIKTPLTSIINYVYLIRREQPENEKILGYLDVLDKKAQHLKVLMEDLVEASKVTSGNVSLELTDIDFVELVHQANGEFEEKFAERNLTIISRLPSEQVMIRADGKSLWRVLENLYNNAYKYALKDSRVYVSMDLYEGYAEYIMKNISETPLNISADELTERFVRGDVSRTTEGSGLGLSIVESLTQLQGGNFSINIDGDLFKAVLRFPV